MAVKRPAVTVNGVRTVRAPSHRLDAVRFMAPAGWEGRRDALRRFRFRRRRSSAVNTASRRPALSCFFFCFFVAIFFSFYFFGWISFRSLSFVLSFLSYFSFLEQFRSPLVVRSVTDAFWPRFSGFHWLPTAFCCRDVTAFDRVLPSFFFAQSSFQPL